MLGLLLILYFGANFHKRSVPPSPINIITPSAQITQNQTPSALPLRLKIPSINVDAAVERVGLTSKGAMDVPKDRNNIAWFDPGTRPGDKGSAVVAGHLDWKNGQKAVFENLNKLRPGDFLYVETDSGQSVSFAVRESRVYDLEADTDEIFSSDDGAHLNLITCDGSWDKSQNSYTKRLVVFTDIVD